MLPKKTSNIAESRDLKGGLGRLTGALAEATTSLINRGSNLLDQSDAGKKVKEMGSQAADVAGKVYEEATATGKKLGDNLSGAEAQARIAALVEQQRRYNDILATRLAEALDRIEKLETHVARLSRGR